MKKIATFNSPKWTGEKVATVISLPTSRKVKVRAMTELHNGDGLGYFNKSGEFVGFRLNRIDGNILHAATDIDATPGTALYRNNDKEWNDALEAKETASRNIEISIRLRTAASQLVLDITDAYGTGISVSTPIEHTEAKTDQHANRARILTKLGDTPLCCHERYRRNGQPVHSRLGPYEPSPPSHRCTDRHLPRNTRFSQTSAYKTGVAKTSGIL